MLTGDKVLPGKILGETLAGVASLETLAASVTATSRRTLLVKLLPVLDKLSLKKLGKVRAPILAL